MTRIRKQVCAFFISAGLALSGTANVGAFAMETQPLVKDPLNIPSSSLSNSPARFVTIATAWNQTLNLRDALDEAAGEVGVATANLPEDTVIEVVENWEGWMSFCCSTYTVSTIIGATSVSTTFAARDDTKPVSIVINLATRVGKTSSVPVPKPIQHILKTARSLAKVIDAFANSKNTAPRDLSKRQLAEATSRWAASKKKVKIEFTNSGLVTVSTAFGKSDTARASIILSSSRKTTSEVAV